MAEFEALAEVRAAPLKALFPSHHSSGPGGGRRGGQGGVGLLNYKFLGVDEPAHFDRRPRLGGSNHGRRLSVHHPASNQTGDKRSERTKHLLGGDADIRK